MAARHLAWLVVGASAVAGEPASAQPQPTLPAPGGAQATAAAPRSIDAAIAAAAGRDRLLVVEVGAAWCQPCRYFESFVLPQPAVQHALADVDFVRYDIDAPTGAEVARRYAVRGVPTFLVIDGTGHVLKRQGGFVGRTSKQVGAQFVAFLTGAADVRALSLVEAAALREDLAAGRARVRLAVDGAASFVRRFPGTPQATERLAIVVVAGQLPAAETRALVMHHLAHVPDDVDAAEAVRVGLLAGADVPTEALARRRLTRTPLDPAARLLLAEVQLHRGAVDHPRAVVREVCRAAPPSLQLRCYVLEDALLADRGSVGVGRVRRDATVYLEQLEHPGSPSMLLVDLDGVADQQVFGNALAGVLRAAGRRCRTPEVRGLRVSVSIHVAPAGGVPEEVDVYEDEPVRGCLRDAIRRSRLPAPPASVDPHLLAVVAIAGREKGEPPFGASPPIGQGALVFGAVRQGATSSIGVGAHGLHGFGPLADLRLAAGWQVEAAVTGGGATAYALRAMGGVGMRLTGNGVLSALIGVGVSGAGDTEPDALELPIELRLQFERGVHRGHVWGRASQIFGVSARQESVGSAWLDGDEIAIGAGASRPIGGGRLFVGALYEQHAAGRSASLLIGLPIGRYF